MSADLVKCLEDLLACSSLACASNGLPTHDIATCDACRRISETRQRCRDALAWASKPVNVLTWEVHPLAGFTGRCRGWVVFARTNGTWTIGNPAGVAVKGGTSRPATAIRARSDAAQELRERCGFQFLEVTL